MNKYAAFDHLIEGAQVIDSNWRYVYVNDVVANHGKAPKDLHRVHHDGEISGY